MSKTSPERNEVILAALLEHPFLHHGFSAESAWNYMLGRMHHDRHQEKWRESSRKMAFWLKNQGFVGINNGSINKYHWIEKDPSTAEE